MVQNNHPSPEKAGRSAKDLNGASADGAPRFKVIGIGASSGGLNACRALLKTLPKETGFAFIFVQHLDPVHDSMLAELLTRQTSMAVMQATDGMPVEPDHLYVIPPGFYLSIEKGKLRLSEPKVRHGARMPFDFLLHSLAGEYGARAVSVVLSGTGADGSEGVASIKQAGGLVIIQDPDEAEFDGMPRNAIASGTGHLVLPTREIAKAIVDYRPDMPRPLPGSDARITQRLETTDQLRDIIVLLKTSSNNDFSLYKQGTLQRRVERRMAMLGIHSNGIDRYLALLRESPQERQLLANDLLINVTEFFRDAEVFRYLKHTTIPDIVASKIRDGIVRIWIAGCSTGEEAYSLAILFLECIRQTGEDVQLQVFASDADEEAVMFAREGRYPTSIVEAVPADILQSYFSKNDNSYTVTAQLRSCVVFAVQNVLSDPPFSRVDLVSCRNLLIYLETEAQAKALAMFGFALNENGILVLGSSETVGRMDDRFKIVSKSERIYRRVGRHRPDELQFKSVSPDSVRVPTIPGQTAPASRHGTLADTLRRGLLQHYAPAALLINRRYEYLYALGTASKYLQIAPGPASHDLFTILPRNLHNKVRSAIQRAIQEKTLAIARGAKLENNGVTLKFSIQITPLLDDEDDLLLVCFIDDPEPHSRPEPQQGSTTPEAGRVSELELELDETRAELQGAIRNLEIASEEQKSVNAEALSLNEEYQSTNEELFTSKEELQSLNEELTALNSQLHETLERQRATSNDLENVLYSTDVATLFLDNALNIRFFTPATRTLFSIIPGDIGRPLADLNALTNDEGLREDALGVLESGDAVDREIGARNGRWYIRRIKPYRTQEGEIEGVVITFIDISLQKQATEEKEAAKKAAESATEAKSHFLAAASHDLRQPLQTLKLLQGLLEKTATDEATRNLVVRLEDTLESMSSILNTVLDINQIEAGMVRARPENFSIQSMMEKMLKEFAYPAQAKGLTFRMVPSSLAVRTDPRLLEQMLRNLLSNALKYTPAGKILLGCRRSARHLMLEVWDTGIGIPDGQIENVFKEYHQLGSPAISSDRGLGLGLSIVKRLSELTGLRVSVRSRLDKGSVFSVKIDLAPTGQPVVALAPNVSWESASPTGSVSILMVEDEPGLRDLLKMGLEQNGHTVTTAGSGSEAVSIITASGLTPDLLLVDYNLSSEMDGLAAIEAIRDILKTRIPALVLTGNISTDALIKFAAHRVPHLTKPVKLREVQQAIETLLNPSSAQLAPDADDTDYGTQRVLDVIDDEKSVRDMICSLFEGLGWEVKTYATSEEYLEAYDPDRSSCLLLDAYLPGMNGLELLRTLRHRGHRFPVVVITGHSDVHMAVEAMKSGAADFIEKPLSPKYLHSSVRMAIGQYRNANKREDRRDVARAALAKLTARQKQILERIILGQPNKIIAADLGLSQRTVENHRASIMRRTNSSSLPALLRLVVTAEE